MSDKSEGPGWWIASDGKWYPPEQHPSVRGEAVGEGAAQPASGPPPRRWQGQAARTERVGPQFPDLFQKALQGSHLADNISVKYDGDDERNVAGSTSSTSSTNRTRSPGGGRVAVGVAGSSIDAPAKRKWRKGR
jgi:hypothetical protein